MIKLYQFRPALGLSSASPFCMKLETFLKMAGLDYETVWLSDPRKAPKGKLPFIDDDNHRMADSGLIIDYLNKTRHLDLDASLSPADKAVSLAWIRALEEHFYWSLVYSRWMDEAHWPTVKAAYFAGLPAVLKDLIPALARKQVRANLYGHGLGRHSAEDIYAMGEHTLHSLADFMADKPYVMGEAPTSADATVYAFIASVLVPPLETTLKRAAMVHKNLQAYCRRMDERYSATSS